VLSSYGAGDVESVVFLLSVRVLQIVSAATVIADGPWIKNVLGVCLNDVG
jgi:hypothetical protein